MKPLMALVPDFYDDFHCTGSECDITCCTTAWGIFLEKQTYSEYKNVRDPSLREMFNNGIRRYKGEGKSDHMYAVVKAGEKGLCYFLDENGLCEIQKRLGEKALCSTCKIFPRTQLLRKTDDRFEAGMTMACPEVVRLALFNERGITFRETEIKKENIVYKMPIRLLQDRDKGWRDMYFDVRDICMAVLRDRGLSVADRLMAVIMYLNKLESAADITSAAAISESVLTNLTRGGFNGLLDSFSDNEAIAADMEEAVYFEIMNARMRSDENSYRLVKLFDNFLDFIRVMDDENKIEKSSKKYAIREYLKEKSSRYWPEFLEKYSYVLENYFVLLTFNKIIMLKPDDLSAFETAFCFAEQYAKIKLLICTNAEDYGGITEKLITDAAVLMSRSFEHGAERKHVLDYYKNKQLLTPAHCSFLLR